MRREGKRMKKNNKSKRRELDERMLKMLFRMWRKEVYWRWEEYRQARGEGMPDTVAENWMDEIECDEKEIDSLAKAVLIEFEINV